MSRSSSLSTRVLLICAAIAVATGLLSAFAGWLSAPVVAGAPVAYGLVLTMHLLPGVVAQEVLRKPWVALITHALAALIAAATMPVFILNYVAAVVLMGGVQEGWAAIGRYRRWSMSWFLAGGAVLGLVLGFSAGLAIGLKHLPFWGTVLTIALTVIGAIGWTFVSVAIGRALRRAGVARS